MLLLDNIETYRLLDPQQPGWCALTANDNGAVIATGRTREESIANLTASVRELQYPTVIPFPYHDRAQYQYCNKEWMK